MDVATANIDILNVSSTCESSLIPNSALLDLGSVSNKWGNLYVDTNISTNNLFVNTISSTGNISFNSTSVYAINSLTASTVNANISTTSINSTGTINFNNKDLNGILSAEITTVKANSITAISGNDIDFNNKNLNSILSANITTLYSNSITAISGNDINFNSKNLNNVSRLEVTYITSPGTISFDNKNLSNIGQVGASSINTGTVQATTVQNTSSFLNLSAVTDINAACDTFNLSRNDPRILANGTLTIEAISNMTIDSNGGLDINTGGIIDIDSGFGIDLTATGATGNINIEANGTSGDLKLDAVDNINIGVSANKINIGGLFGIPDGVTLSSSNKVDIIPSVSVLIQTVSGTITIDAGSYLYLGWPGSGGPKQVDTYTDGGRDYLILV